MKKGGGVSEDAKKGGKKFNGPDSIKSKKKMVKKNMQRLGGAGLSLEAFANAKTRNDNYNPALISMHLSLSIQISLFDCHRWNWAH